jgi:sec-independent protein translocase protein TatA
MTPLGIFQQIGATELIIILLIALLLFGRRLPEVGRGLGRSIAEFKKGLKDTKEEIDKDSSDKDKDKDADKKS